MVCSGKYFINIMDLDTWQITTESTTMALFNEPGVFGVGKDLYLMYNSRTPSNKEKAWWRDGETGQWQQVEGMTPPTSADPSGPEVATFIPDDFYSC